MQKNRIFGIGEPLAMRASDGDIDPKRAIDLIEAVGFTAAREWLHIPFVLENPITPKKEIVELCTKILNRYEELDIEITGLSHNWFLAGKTIKHGENSMYSRDITPKSLYMQTLEMLEQSWFTLATVFPQVKQWEVGNEWNSDTFLHPIGWVYGTAGFSDDEKMDIAMDMMFYSAKGIRRANSVAKVVSFSPAVSIPTLGSKSPLFAPPGYGIALTLTKIYERIKSGKFGSDKSDDFFDMLAWHPYLLTQIMPMAISETYPAMRRFFREEDVDSQWRSVNDMAYTIMAMNGDGNKKVLLTEMGFSDWGDAAIEKKQVLLNERMFEIAKTMPYIKTIHTFRLIMEARMLEVTDPGQIGGKGEVYFGMFHEKDKNYAPRDKAYALQHICGGTKPLVVKQ